MHTKLKLKTNYNRLLMIFSINMQIMPEFLIKLY